MKRFTLLVLAFFLLTGFTSGQYSPAYYASEYEYSNALPEGQARDVTNFTTVQDGAVVLTDGVFYPQFDGLMKVSGVCDLKAEPLVFRLSIIRAGRDYIVHDGGQYASFSVTFPVSPFALTAYQERGVQNANRVRCSILVEAVR